MRKAQGITPTLARKIRLNQRSVRNSAGVALSAAWLGLKYRLGNLSGEIKRHGLPVHTALPRQPRLSSRIDRGSPYTHSTAFLFNGDVSFSLTKKALNNVSVASNLYSSSAPPAEIFVISQPINFFVKLTYKITGNWSILRSGIESHCKGCFTAIS